MKKAPRTAEPESERRARARRAVDEAHAAGERLRLAREQVEGLLRRHCPGTGANTPESLQARMRRIESRMQATDAVMRTAERGFPGARGEDS